MLNSFDSILQGIPMDALIAIPAISVALLIPLATFLTDNKNNKYIIDKTVIIKKVLLLRWYVTAIITNSIILLLNNNLLSLVSTALTVTITVIVINRSYKWFCSYDELEYGMTFNQKLRIDYLNSISNKREAFEAWSLLLNDEKLSEKNQVGLFKCYQNTYNNLFDADFDDNSSVDLFHFLNILNKNIDKIDLSNPNTFQDMVVFSLGYYRQKYEYEQEHKRIPIHQLNELFKNLFLESQNKDKNHLILDYIFFDTIDNYAKSSYIPEDTFLEYFINDMFSYMQLIKYQQLIKIWDQPYIKNIRVSKANITENTSQIICSVYQKYLYSTIQWPDNDDNNEYRVLEKATEKIFTDIDLIAWFDIMSFCIIGFPIEQKKSIYYSQILNWCKYNRKYGHTGRLDTFFIENNQSIDEKIRENWKKEYSATISLAKLFEPWLNNKAEIKKYIEACKEIKNSELLRKQIELKRLDTIEWHLRNIQKSNQKHRKTSNTK